jgi:hypothetical protein
LDSGKLILRKIFSLDEYLLAIKFSIQSTKIGEVEITNIYLSKSLYLIL